MRNRFGQVGLLLAALVVSSGAGWAKPTKPVKKAVPPHRVVHLMVQGAKAVKAAPKVPAKKVLEIPLPPRRPPALREKLWPLAALTDTQQWFAREGEHAAEAMPAAELQTLADQREPSCGESRCVLRSIGLLRPVTTDGKLVTTGYAIADGSQLPGLFYWDAWARRMSEPDRLDRHLFMETSCFGAGLNSSHHYDSTTTCTVEVIDSWGPRSRGIRVSEMLRKGP